jgi:hypothetical protein
VMPNHALCAEESTWCREKRVPTSSEWKIAIRVVERVEQKSEFERPTQRAPHFRARRSGPIVRWPPGARPSLVD